VDVILASDMFQFLDCWESFLLISGAEIHFGIVFEESLSCQISHMSKLDENLCYLASLPANSCVSTSYKDNLAREVGHVSGRPSRCPGEYFLEQSPE
jgi:hypothetical protein